MIINETGKICEGFYMLGTPAIPVYLLKGENSALFDAGLSFLGRIYVEAIREVLESKQPRYCFLTHSHYDHCGAISILKKSFPALNVAASEEARKFLGRSNVIELIDNLTQAAEQIIKNIGVDLTEFDRFEPFEVDLTLKDGDTIEISDGLTVQAFETPGHTLDCLSYYIPQKRVLISSESMGIPDQTGYIISDCLLDYDKYYESMIRLSHLDFDVLCLGHLRSYTGEDARRHLQDSINFSQKFLKMVEFSLVENNGDVQKVIKSVKKFEYDNKKRPIQTEAAYLLNLEARVKAIKRRMEKTDPKSGSVFKL